MKSKIFAYITVGIVLCLSALLGIGVLKISGSSNDSKLTNREINGSPYKKEVTIDPTPFNVGYIKDSPQKLANLCKDDYSDVKSSADFNNAKYPINPLYVNYGGKPFPKDCKCTEFISSP